ncbi:MAG: response regulator [Bacteroidales bacterium]|nr:response regulator [Bacteroidales bacterium]
MKKHIPIILAAAFLAASCHKDTEHVDVLRSQVDSAVYSAGDTDSLSALFAAYGREGNSYGEMAAALELGKRLRNESRFYDAIDVHKKGLAAAEKLRDTLQIVQALNNIGTNYRRLGILDEASSWHYSALSYCDQYSGSRNPEDRTALKNRVVTLNGIGNVQLTMGNDVEAEKAFRQALSGETSLGSALGQAINYANLGSILESRDMKDSARFYYEKSLEFNTLAKSDLGISLCHAHFGRLAEKEGDYANAIEEYRKAYEIMEGSSDVWHWLESAVSLVRAYINAGDLDRASFYLGKATKEAERISSMEYLAEVNRLDYLIQKQRGNSALALKSYVRSREYADSVTSEKNLNHIQNVRVGYERERKQNEIEMLNRSWEAERRSRNALLTMSLIALLLTVATIAVLIYLITLRNRNQKMLKEMETMKSNFFTNITHEFRTPLTVIHSAAGHIMKETPVDSPLHRDAEDIMRHGKSLLSLINQILDIAKLSSGSRCRPEYCRGDIVGYVTMICECHRPYARTRDISIIYSPAEPSVEMDFIPEYVKQTVSNLLSNAIKFSAEGRHIMLTSKCKDGDFILTVCDEGKGMAPEVLRNIFKPFYQAPDQSMSIGTGVGLSIVKLDVEAMNGRIEVHSAVGKGTVFIVALPLSCGEKLNRHFDFNDYVQPCAIREVVETECEANEDVVHEGMENATRILIVEDTPEVARLQMNQLNSDFNYYFAQNGAEGLERAAAIVPDLIITDVMMPGMDGFEFCRRLRASGALNHIPVIMVTAKCTHEDKMAGLEAGADAFLEKPFHADELNVRVVKLLEQRSLLQQKWSSDIDDGSRDLSGVPESSRKFINDFTDAVNNCLKTGELDHNTIADALCITRIQLNRKVKAITGLTTTEYISRIRISLAKKLLDNPDMLIGDIAQRCGVEDVAYFSSVFKKATGYTPSGWRNRRKSLDS